MKLRKFLIALLVASLTAVFIIAGCAPTKIPAGKYVAEDNPESYIEVLEDNKVKFVNVDFTKFEEANFDSPLYDNTQEVADIFGDNPQDYVFFEGSSREGYDHHIYIEVFGNEDEGIGFSIHWSQSENKIYCLGVIYKLQ